MNEEYAVIVHYEKNQIEFRFINLSDATEFASTCIECGNDGVYVEIKRVVEE